MIESAPVVWHILLLVLLAVVQILLLLSRFSMSRRGHRKDKAPAEEPSSREESGWQGVRTELRGWMRGISQAFGKSGPGRASVGDSWLRQLSKLHPPTFKGTGTPEESET